MATIYQKAGNNIKALRKRLGITQEDLAGLAKIDPKSIIQIEAGNRNPTLKTIKKIALSLKVSVGKLVD